MLKSTSNVGAAPRQSQKKERRNVHNEPKPRKPLLNILPRVHPGGWDAPNNSENPQFREFGENELKRNQPTQAMCKVLEIIIPWVKVQVFETENFPPFAPDWGRSLSGSCQCNKAAIGVFSPRIPTDIWVQAPWNSPNNNLPPHCFHQT